MAQPSYRAPIIVAAAQACIGAPFRVQGRDPAVGLDCVGLVARAYAATGRVPVVPQGYTLKGNNPRGVVRTIQANGFRRIAADCTSPGDLLLLRPGPRQLHLAVMSYGCFIHAHAGLRRVVETPGRPQWPLIGVWRYSCKSSPARGGGSPQG